MKLIQHHQHQPTVVAICIAAIFCIDVRPAFAVPINPAAPVALVTKGSTAATAVTDAAAAPLLQYQSPFSDYRPLGADKRTPWKAANDEVGKIGGWRVYAREAAQDAVQKTDAVEGAIVNPLPAAGRPSTTTQNAPNTAPVLTLQPVPQPASKLVPALPASDADKKHAGHHAPEVKK